MTEQEQINQLIAAHRQLAARHEALFQLCKAMFAMAPASQHVKTQIANLVRQVLELELHTEPFDDQYRLVAMTAISELVELGDLQVRPH